MQLLVRNTVKDFAVWYDVFMADMPRGKPYGISLERLWQSAEDPNTVFFVLNIEDKAKVDAFMALPKSAKVGELAGAIDGEIWYLEPVT